MYELKEYLNSINYEKNNLMDSGDVTWEKKYPAYVVNKCLAPFNDTVMLVNEMNRNHHLDKKLQYDFLLNSLRTRRRFAPWMRSSKSKNLEYVKEYYGYNNEKGKSALNILNDEQIKQIKEKLNKGGKHGKR
ncbi:MAG: DNA polymerase [Alphaproteobacteria bacterium TMED194]|nr:MAG: DNA polymerase [Alphaproteobacteria bacterium TMED194]|tara:strand:+ start:12330 stop:12725 length:396 start_codon:yes stop_codon:yes gene_type:complete